MRMESIEQVQTLLSSHLYVADERLATVIYLSLKLKKPLFLEGETGVGKTEVGKVLSEALKRRLIRLQCYEGLDQSSALYEWNYPKQLLQVRMDQEKRCGPGDWTDIFTPDFLIGRPLLDAVQSGARGEPPVLLIDEIDRADDEFEAFLLEFLSEFQVTIPEIGTIRAKDSPLVVITSNRTREVHEALKRRCLYHWIEYPTLEKEMEIIRLRLPHVNEHLARQISEFMKKVRSMDFIKRPGVAESLDWAEALVTLHREHLDAKTVSETLACVFKYREDLQRFDQCVTEIMSDPSPTSAG
ncbi:MAG: MoxR family ATPase [Deltaproteobacteria bacterium]|nr:MoxR family ATPase [Deltaproteobacteria bacterium]